MCPTTAQKGATTSVAPQDEMLELRGTVTEANVASAFARDSQAQKLFAMFERTAEIEGHGDVARAFRELTELQSLFADGHLDILRRTSDPTTGLPLGDTLHNLRVAIALEQMETSDGLVAMARTAHAEGFPDVASWFETLIRTKRAHLRRLEEALVATRYMGAESVVK